MLSTIMVPLDGSPAAESVLPYVQLLAVPSGASVHLITVAAAHGAPAASAYLDKTAGQLRAGSLTCSARVIAGAEAQAILDEADAIDADLIAMSTHGRSGLMRWVIGSVADKVVHGMSRPLLLVRARDAAERPPAKVERVLVPLDGSPLSLSVLPYVEEVAALLGASLVLYNAVLPLDIYPGAELAPTRIGSVIDDLLEQGQAFLAQVAKEVGERGSVKADSIVTIGFPVDEVVRVAQEVGAGLIAMATHGRSGVNRWVLGSVADGVVRRSSLPCLLVRPEQQGEEK
jgi:nucleotide-binding universal stress UspA family protein